MPAVCSIIKFVLEVHEALFTSDSRAIKKGNYREDIKSSFFFRLLSSATTPTAATSLLRSVLAISFLMPLSLDSITLTSLVSFHVK